MSFKFQYVAEKNEELNNFKMQLITTIASSNIKYLNLLNMHYELQDLQLKIINNKD